MSLTEKLIIPIGKAWVPNPTPYSNHHPFHSDVLEHLNMGRGVLKGAIMIIDADRS